MKSGFLFYNQLFLEKNVYFSKKSFSAYLQVRYHKKRFWLFC
ncbi:hypothetical protein BLGI_2518 [Brevibacillus laterosporus GI-9]|nr:hypothetical protein BLGI_2518 [Brevibacillus laterosporus GI-9]